MCSQRVGAASVASSSRRALLGAGGCMAGCMLGGCQVMPLLSVCAQGFCLRTQTCARALPLTPPCPFASALLLLLHLCVLTPPTQVEEYADEVFDLLDNGAHMYFCGLKGMMPGILDMLQRVSKEKGRNFDEFVEGLKHKNQWHVSSVWQGMGAREREREREGPEFCGWGLAAGRRCRAVCRWCRLMAAHACRMCGQSEQLLTTLSVCCCLLAPLRRLRCTKRVLAQSCCAVRLYISERCVA